MKKNLINLVLIFIVVAIFVWLIATFYKAYQSKPFVLQGQIEAQRYSVSSKVAGRVDQVFVKKGDKVKKGELIFSINSPELEAKIDQARAGKNAAKAMSKKANKGARKQQIKAAYENYQKAKVANELAKTTYERVKNLFKDGVVSKQKADEAKAQYEASLFTKKAAYSMYEMAKEGSEDETKEAAKEQEKAAQSVLNQVKAVADDLKIKSFYDGEVTRVLVQSGELASSGFPVVEITDMSDAWVVLHVREDMLKNFNKGKIFKAKIPALGDKIYKFRVSFVSVMGEFATWRATDTRKDYDMRTYEVEARALEKIKDLRVGMSVLVQK